MLHYDCSHEGHAIPLNDSEEHQPNDWCPCRPDLVQTDFGQFWRHSCFNFADLLDHAESIRMITSVQLERERITGPHDTNVEFVPFPFGGLQWPPSTDRTQGPPELQA